MDLYFFCAVDENPIYRREAEILIESGRTFGREIHLYDIPATEVWNRYKVNLFLADLPPADRYIYLDSDCCLTGPGDWEAPDCLGVCDVLYYCNTLDRSRHTKGFMRNHTLLVGEKKGYDYLVQLYLEHGSPPWCNSGVVVLSAADRLPFARVWKDWMNPIDAQCEKGFMVGDEGALLVARQEYGLPLLPPRFNGMCKWQPIFDWHVLIHADGNVGGPKRQPYLDALQRVRNLKEKRS